jgi:serine/threonine protein kinase
VPSSRLEATVAPGSSADERTLALGRGGPALPAGHALQEFVIEGVLGEGGFGIVYRALDTRLRRSVALKEYMPTALAARHADLSVSARSEWEREIFDTGLKSFVNEAQLLASFDHASLVKVHRFWEGNGTAYMVMPLYKGITLKRWLQETGVKPDQRWLLGLLLPLIDALEQLHSAEPCCLHRDVAPDNVLLLEPPRVQADVPPVPLLLDFGAARRVIGDKTGTLTVFLKPGYAPIEQYGEGPSMKQGPWTDVYALSAVLYACITGRAPLASADRILDDSLVPAVQAGAGRYSRQFLAAIDAGLKVRPEQRPQSMRELRSLFSESLIDAAPAAAQAGDEIPRSTSRRALAWSAGALSVVAAAGAWWALRPEATPSTVTTQGASASAPRDAGDARASAIASAPGVAAPSAPSASGQVAVSAPPTPFSVLAALHDIVERADPKIAVGSRLDKSSLVIGKDSLRFRVRSSEAGYLYVFFGGTDKSHFHLLFPNRLDRANRIEPGAELALPRAGWEIDAGGPPGTNHLVVLVSRHERDMSQVGLRQTDEPIPLFDLKQAERLWLQRSRTASPFVGRAMCAAPDCSEAFGATMLMVDEVAARRN